MPDWVVWVIFAAVLALGEVLTLGFLLGMFALAAVVAGVVAAAGGSLVLQLIVFIAASLASLALVRPIAKRHLRTPAQLRTGIARAPPRSSAPRLSSPSEWTTSAAR